MCNITKGPYRLALAFITLVFSSASVQAETNVIASGALNLFFPHSGVSISLGQPQTRYHNEIYFRSDTHRYAPKAAHHYQHDARYSKNNRYYKKAPTQYLVIEQPIRQRVVVRADYPGKSEHGRQYQKTKYKERRDDRAYRHGDKHNNHHRD
jgi:hypothetical protein